MRVVLVHNEYAKLSGEDIMVGAIARTLREHGHRVSLFLRHSADVLRKPLGRARAFFSGIHSFSACRDLERLLIREQPDVVQIQNVYPLISPGAFEVAGRLGTPVVFRCANYRLFCPNGLLMTHGEICERCTGGREFWCTLRNCEGSLAKSAGYTLRNAWAYRSGVIRRNTTMYMVPSHFQREKFADGGIPRDRIAVVPDLVQPADPLPESGRMGDYVAYAGRVSAEKGIEHLVAAMTRRPEVRCRIAGDHERLPGLAESAPPNVEFLGMLPRDRLDSFYAGARFLVAPSICYETFGLVMVEAMLQRRPVIGSRIGSIPEVIEEGVTGLLFEPGNIDELAEKIFSLWGDPDRCREMGIAARKKAVREFAPQRFYGRLMSLYTKAIQRAGVPVDAVERQVECA